MARTASASPEISVALSSHETSVMREAISMREVCPKLNMCPNLTTQIGVQTNVCLLGRLAGRCVHLHIHGMDLPPPPPLRFAKDRHTEDPAKEDRMYREEKTY